MTNYDAKRAKQFLHVLAGAGAPVYFVPGNMDSVELRDWPGDEDVHALHGRCEYRGSLALIGVGGSPHGPFRSPFEYDENEAALLLEKAVKSYSGGNLILLSHCPPKDTKIDLAFTGEHAGSLAVRRFVEKVQPVLVVSGHIHEAQGIDAIRNSTLVNTGPAQRGNFAEIVLNNGVKVDFARLF